MIRESLNNKGNKHGIDAHAGKIIKSVLYVVLICMWFPMAVLFILSLSGDGLLAFPPESLTLEWYVAIFTDPAALSAIKNSLTIGVAAMITTITFAMLFAIGLDRLEFELKTTALYVIMLPLIIPGIVGGVAVFQFAEFLGISGIPVVIAVHVVVTLPYATLILLETLSNYNRSFEEASMNLGADELETFRQVTLPNIQNGVIAASLLVFTFSFNEFIFTYFVRGDSFQTLPIYLWGQTYQGISPIVNSVSVLFMLIATTMVLAAVLVTNIRKVSRVE